MNGARLPEGFFASGLSCGIKQSQRKDLGLIVSESPAQIVGVFTKNSVKAFCVQDNFKLIKSKELFKALIVNSGNANVCTGEQGLEAIRQIKNKASEILEVSAENIFTASTGIIGVPLKTECILNSLSELKIKLSKNFKSFAQAILTTDSEVKISFRELNNKSCILGIAKGSGMINPNMATMLCFVLTDACIERAELQKCLSSTVEETFNQISVDNDTSTNDMVLLISNSASNEKIDPEIFKKNLTEICTDLAKQIVRDGEGATKIFEIEVNGLKSQESCRKVAKTIASSYLVKSAIAGSDPNWGRILASAGRAEEINQNILDLRIQDILVFSKGVPVVFDKNILSELMKKSDEIFIKLDFSETKFSAKAWGCDLTEEYVKINSEYTT